MFVSRDKGLGLKELLTVIIVSRITNSMDLQVKTGKVKECQEGRNLTS